MPTTPPGAQAIHKVTPDISLLGLLLQLLPRLSHPPGVCFKLPPPGVSRPTSLPFALGVPSQRLSCGAWNWFSQSVSNPSPPALCNLFSHWELVGFLPEFNIAYCVWPITLRLRQMLMKVWTFLMLSTLVLHVCAPYSKTDFTFELNSLTFLCKVTVSSLVFHTFFLVVQMPPLPCHFLMLHLYLCHPACQ